MYLSGLVGLVFGFVVLGALYAGTELRGALGKRACLALLGALLCALLRCGLNAFVWLAC